MMHLAVCSANLKPETLNCNLVLGLFRSLICSQKNLECRMRLTVLLGCQRKLAYSKPSLAPAGCQDVSGRKDFGYEGEALSLDHHLGEAVSHLQNRICFANPHYLHQFFVLVFFSKPIYDQCSGLGKQYSSMLLFTSFPWSCIWTAWGKTGFGFTFDYNCR